MNGPATRRLLAESGIQLLSDGVRKTAEGPERVSEGLWEFPINIIPDHEHLYHAERTPEWVEQWVKRYQWSDDFGSASYYIEEWTDLVLQQLGERERAGVTSNLIIHPITMYLCDRFEGFKKILSYLGSRETKLLNEIIPPMVQGSSLQFGEKSSSGVN